MTTPRATSRRTSLERHKDEVIALLLTGSKQEEIATKYKVNPSSLTKFMRRHEERLASLREKVTKQVEDYAIAHKVNRVAELQYLWDITRKEVEDYGVTIVETRTEKDGETEVTYVSREYRADLVREGRAILNQVAAELGQLPRPEQNVNLRAQVLIREIAGFDPEQLG